MFRKIHSNRYPKDTILSQLKTEFQPYFECCSKQTTQLLKRKPKLIFGTMICLMAFSAAASFTLMRNKEPADHSKTVKKKSVNVITDGFDQISTTARTIKQTLHLKQEIDSISAKRTLTKQDSDMLENDLDQLRWLNQPSKP